MKVKNYSNTVILKINSIKMKDYLSLINQVEKVMLYIMSRRFPQAEKVNLHFGLNGSVDGKLTLKLSYV